MSKVSWKVIILSSLLGLTGSLIAGHGIYIRIKADVAQYLLQQAWISSKQLGYGVAPWPWADTKPLAKLTFVKQNQTYIIMAGSSGRTLAFAPGHLSGSALPGQPGHSIISGHRDTHFSVLEKLQNKEQLVIETLDNKKHHYIIEAINIVDIRSDALVLEPERGFLTLLTCFPFDAINAGSPFRYRIDAELIADPYN